MPKLPPWQHALDRDLSAPFDATLDAKLSARIQASDPFQRIDPTRFPTGISLDHIIRQHARLRRCQAGDLLVRCGDYGTSTFFVLSGHVRVVTDHGLSSQALGRSKLQRHGYGRGLWQLLQAQGWAEARQPKSYRKIAALGVRHSLSDHTQQIYLRDIEAIQQAHQTIRLGPGDLFGELAAMGRAPRSTTVFADGEAEIIELRWQGLRLLRRYADELRQNIDKLYRHRGLLNQLRILPCFQSLDPQTLTTIAEKSLFESYGGDGQATIIAEEGHYVDGLIVVRSGFAQRCQRWNQGQRIVDYLGPGEYFGLAELAANQTTQEKMPLANSLFSIGYTEVLRIPTPVVERYVLPNVAKKKLTLVRSGASPIVQTQHGALDSSLLRFVVEEQRVQGQSALWIDLNRCTHCDDCVRACAATHDNNPRFIRQGPVWEHYMIADACMHCYDPVCMANCPTGAIHRHPNEATVVIDDHSCIGCSACANDCPFQAIHMVAIQDHQGTRIINRQNLKPELRATQCDLCSSQPPGIGPACERACPHRALKRINMNTPEQLAAWIKP